MGRARLAFPLMAALAIFVAIFSLRFYAVLFGRWPQIDPGIHEVIARVPLQALTHMLIAPIPLLLGVAQFSARLRGKYPKAHRITGRLYVAACVLSGLGALATAPYASGGPIAGLGFGILGLCWIGATAGAWRAAVRRDFARHRLLMRYSYAMTFGAVTLRLQIPIGFALGAASYPAMSVWLAYTAWVPNVIAVWLYSIWERGQREKLTATGRGEEEALT